jgi:hypothetical protein
LQLLLPAAHLLCHSAAQNGGNGLNAQFDATEDYGKLKQGVLNPAFDLQLDFFHMDRHVMDGFNSILDPIDLPMNGLHDTFDILRNQTNVATDGTHLEAYGIDQFLCFMGCPANLEKDRDQENKNQHHDRRNNGNTGGQ